MHPLGNSRKSRRFEGYGLYRLRKSSLGRMHSFAFHPSDRDPSLGTPALKERGFSHATRCAKVEIRL